MFDYPLRHCWSHRRLLCDRLVWLLAMVAVLLPSLRLQAQAVQDNVITRSIAGRDVLKMTSALESPSSALCGVAKISIMAPRPSLADRNLEVVVYLKEYYSSPSTNTAYRQSVRLPEGASRIDLEIPFVQPRSHVIWDIDLFEDGRNIENKPPTVSFTPNFNTMGSDTTYAASLGLMAPGESETELNAAVNLIASRLHPNINPGAVSTTTGIVPVLATTLPIDQATDDWRRYFSYDMIILTPRGVAEVNQDPDVAEALRTCVAAGGALMVISIADSAGLEEVAKLLNQRLTTEFNPTSDSESNSELDDNASTISNKSDDKTAVWLKPQTWMGTSLPKGESTAKQRLNGIAIEDKIYFPSLSADEPMLESIRQHGIVQRGFGFGNVHLSAVTPELFPTADNAMFFGRAHPRIAFTTDTDSDWFWRNLIRAVGKPPVWMFCGIVTLFGALLGPGLLALTGRLKRRSLMIFLVPAISLVASLAIVVYGVLSEGFDTHLRVTSVQAIDGDSKLGFVWSRQNFFSGLPPREGLSFSPQTYARPVYAEVSDRGYYDGVDPRKGLTCTINLESEQQRWSDWLRPRQQQQLLVGNRIEQFELPIGLTRAGDTRLSLMNKTASALPIVVVRGAAEDYYVTVQLAAGQTVELNAIDEAQANAKVAQLMAEYRPKVPAELGQGGSLLDFGTGARQYSLSIGPTSSSYQDILNVSFTRWMSDKMHMPPFGFSVLATESDAVDVPLDGLMADSLHLIVGVKTW